VPVPGPVALSVTPPGKLARTFFASLIYNRAGRAWKMRTPGPVENGPANRNHATLIFPPRFPVQGERETVMLVLQIHGTGVACVKRCHEQNQSRH